MPRIEPARWDAMAAALRARVERRLVKVGELLGGSPLSPGDGQDQAMDDYVLAIDAYTAAGKVLDEADSLLDLAGAYVLLDIAANHFAAAAARADGHKPPHASRRCFQNPLHNAAVHEHEHRRKGSGSSRSGKGRAARRDAVQPMVPVCPECLRHIKANQMPDALVVPIVIKARRQLITGVPVPYYALSSTSSLWVATAFGALPGISDEDLVAAALRGEFRPAEPAHGRAAATGPGRVRVGLPRRWR
ncbi:MAG: hypothetical protein ACRDSS_11440 [Actinocrinis sp.]